MVGSVKEWDNLATFAIWEGKNDFLMVFGIFRSKGGPALQWVLSGVAILVLAWGCNSSGGGESVGQSFSEGRVDYTMAWRGAEPDPMFVQMLPSRMTLYFREPMMRFEAKGAGGFAHFSWFVNTENGNTDLFVTVAGVRMHYSESVPRNSIIELVSNKRLPRTASRYFDTVYMGYSCLGLVAELETGETDRCRLVCAPSIGWVGMNAFSIPFDGLEGCMLNGQFDLVGYTMHARARRIISSKLPDSVFMMPTGYRPIEINALRQLLGLQLMD